jgi:hypothetical protein
MDWTLAGNFSPHRQLLAAMRSNSACTRAEMNNFFGGAFMRDLEPDKLPFDTIRRFWREDP